MSRDRRLRDTVNELPGLPGVYIMRDEAGTVIYVGKANSLKNRVASYFQKTEGLDPKTRVLVSKIDSIETIVVNSPAEALILECNLIKRYRPRYNIRLIDEKHYPYLMLTMREDYPRLLVVRQVKDDGGKYFGPYVSVTEMRGAQKLIESIFPLRSCTAKSWTEAHRPCLNAHIGRCFAPCSGRISKEDYRFMVGQIISFLQGKTTDILSEAKRMMYQAAEELRFETAARLREQIKALKELRERQQMDMAASYDNRDMAAVAVSHDAAVAQVFFVRQGKVVGRERCFLENPSLESPEEVLLRFVAEYYAGKESLPPELCLNLPIRDMEEMEAILTQKAGRRVRICLPKRGDKKRLIDLVEKNARIAVEDSGKSASKREEKAAAALLALKDALGLDVVPHRMECYDISHIQGAYTVGAMTVFIDGMPKKSEYRRFRIKTVEGVDDFASLKEVLCRRFRQVRTNGDISVRSVMPDLIIIDGGKGQLSSAEEALAETGVSKARIISLAERFEEIFVPGRKEPIRLPYSDSALSLLRQIRDEAHRFAVDYHRRLRSKGQIRSELSDIPGIGPKRRDKLLAIFRSPAGIKAASVEELHLAGGMDKKTALAIYRYFHPADKTD